MRDWFKKKMKGAQGQALSPTFPSLPAGGSASSESAADLFSRVEPERDEEPASANAAAHLTSAPPPRESLPNDSTLLGEAQRLVEDNRAEEALGVLGQVKVGSLEWATAQYQRARILAGLTRFDEALASVADAVVTDGEKAEYLALQGDLCVRSGRAEMAEIPLQGAAELGVDDTWTYLNLSYLLHGQGRHAEAVAAIRKGLKIRPLDAALVAHLGRFLLAAGQVEEADTVLADAALLHATVPLVHVFRSWVLRARGDLAGAASAMGQAIALDASKAEWHVHLASVLIELGRFSEAGHVAAQAARLDPASEVIRKLTERIALGAPAPTERSGAPASA